MATNKHSKTSEKPLIQNIKESPLSGDCITECRAFYDLFNLVANGIIICDLDGVILDANRSFLLLLNKTKQEIIQKSLFVFLKQLTTRKGSIEEQWKKAVLGIESSFHCCYVRDTDNERLHFEVNLRRVLWQEQDGIFVTINDISEYISQDGDQDNDIGNKSLLESEDYLKLILQNIELPIYCKDLNGRYLNVNSSFEKIVNLTKSDLVQKSDSDVFPDKVAQFLAFKDKEIASSDDLVELEGTFILGGVERNLLIHKFPLKEEDGGVYATAGICTDISVMKKALQAAQLASDAKSEFLANMSHELRTPLHSILSFARLGLKRVESGRYEKLNSFLEMIVTSGDQLLELLNDLLQLNALEVSRQSYKMAKRDLSSDVLASISEFQALFIENYIELVYEIPGSSTMAMYDHTKLAQVMRNLLSNAMKFSRSGEKVIVKIEKSSLGVETEEKQGWKVSVVDQGIGLSDDELENIFVKFIQGKRQRGTLSGVGLGLSICKKIVEDHSGAIWAEQNEYGGATFSFLLAMVET